MAIGIFKSLEFGGINSADYGVYITGEAVYNAPERSVEMVSVPGRNGAVLIDNGRFENIEVTYPAGIPGDDQGDFAEKLSNFRNAILSQRGYQRLTDEYNPNEFRLATYISGMEVEAVEGQQGTIGEFNLVFNCKPQRFLVSGETPVSVTSGGTITNPTPFDSQPIIEVEGEGDFTVNGFKMNIDDAPIGNISLNVNRGEEYTVDIPSGQLNSGDTITLDGLYLGATITAGMTSTNTIALDAGYPAGTTLEKWVAPWFDRLYVDLNLPTTYTYTDQTLTASFSGTVTTYGTTANVSGSLTIKIDTNAEKITITKALSSDSEDISIGGSIHLYSASANSTVSRNGHVFIDCELGEAYKVQDGEIISLNNFFTLGADLPVLSPGANEVTYDSTFTLFKIEPRWWLV